jgi:broad specificity phosphatase PhoE
MHSFIFLRHAESVGNINGRIQGQSDFPLTELGLIQAYQIGILLKNSGESFVKIITSPLKRAYETANCLVELLKVPVLIEPIWMERCFGDFEGKEIEKIKEENPSLEFNHPFIPPTHNAESLFDVYLRASKAVQNLMEYPEGSYLIVSHGAFLNMVVYSILGLSPQSNPYSPRFHFGNTGFLKTTYTKETSVWQMLSFVNTVVKIPEAEKDNPKKQ